MKDLYNCEIARKGGCLAQVLRNERTFPPKLESGPEPKELKCGVCPYMEIDRVLVMMKEDPDHREKEIGGVRVFNWLEGLVLNYKNKLSWNDKSFVKGD